MSTRMVTSSFIVCPWVWSLCRESILSVWCYTAVDSLRPLSDYKALEVRRIGQSPRGDADDPCFRCRQAEFNQVSSSFVEAGEDVVTGTAACEKTSD